MPTLFLKTTTLGRRQLRNGKRSVVGDPINFRALAHAPVNEAGVVLLFGMVARDLGFYIQEISAEFPDCILRRETPRGWEELACEFEFDSRRFLDQKHDPALCDAIVCWRHTWLDCPTHIEVIRLSEEIKKLSSSPIVRLERPF
jgi:hypothetical protein